MALFDWVYIALTLNKKKFVGNNLEHKTFTMAPDKSGARDVI